MPRVANGLGYTHRPTPHGLLLAAAVFLSMAAFHVALPTGVYYLLAGTWGWALDASNVVTAVFNLAFFVVSASAWRAPGSLLTRLRQLQRHPGTKSRNPESFRLLPLLLWLHAA